MTNANDSAAQQLAAHVKAARSLSIRVTDVPVDLLDALLTERAQLIARTPVIPAGEPSINDVVQSITDDMQHQGIPIWHSRWAPEGCTCPWPWPTEAGHILESCPHYEKEA